MPKMVAMLEIQRRLQSVFPNLIDWNPTDVSYQLVSHFEVSELIDAYPAQPWVLNKWECEEIAKSFMLEVRKAEAKNIAMTHNRAIGVAYCSRLAGDTLSHTVNVLITADEVLLLDMQTKIVRPAVEGEDDVYFVEM